MESVTSMHPSSLGTTYGMMELCSVIAIFLTGIATLQTWNYFCNYWNDPVGMKWLVAIIYVLDTMHSAAAVAAVYRYTITNFGNYGVFYDWFWEWRFGIILNGIVAFAVQTYFCDQVRRVRQGCALAGMCWSLSIVRFAFNILMGYTVWTHPVATTLLLPRFVWQKTTTLIVGAASDIAITACICERLVNMRGTGLGRTNRVLDRLVAFTVASGLLTSVVAVTETIVFLKMSHTYAYLIPYAAGTKLFNNMLLARLNDRKNVRDAGDAETSKGTHAAAISVNLDIFASSKQSESTVGQGVPEAP